MPINLLFIRVPSRKLIHAYVCGFHIWMELDGEWKRWNGIAFKEQSGSYTFDWTIARAKTNNICLVYFIIIPCYICADWSPYVPYKVCFCHFFAVLFMWSNVSSMPFNMSIHTNTHSSSLCAIADRRHRRAVITFYYLNQTHRHFWKRRQRSHNEYDFFLNGSTNISAFSWSTAQ